MESKKKQFILNLLSSYGSTLITAILSFVSVPIALNYWGREIYGIWTILTSFATYISASGLGIDVSTGILMTKNSNVTVKLSILKKGIKLLLLCSIIISFIIVIITFVFPDWLKIIGKMDEETYPIAKISGLIFIAGIIINLPLGAIANSLQAFGKAYMNTLFGLFQVVMNFLIILITVFCNFNLPLYIILTIINTFTNNLLKLVFLFYLVHKIKKTDDFSSNKLESNNTNDNRYSIILKTGINMSLYGLAIMLVPNFSNLIISNNVDVASLVPYSLSYKLYSTVIFFATNTNIALAPLLGQEYGKGNWEWLQKIYKKMFYSSVSIAIFLILGVIWFSKPFIQIWTGSLDNYSGNTISITLGLYFFVYVMNNLNITVINTFNYTNKVWFISWAEGAIFLLSSLFLVKKFGVLGVSLGLCLGVYLISLWFYPLWVYKKTEKRFKYDFIYILKNLCILVSSILVFIISDCINVNLIIRLIINFIGFFIFVILLFFVLPSELKEILLRKIRRS